METASREDRAIVGWSFFDRDRLIEACPDRAADINAHYVNALQLARRWRSTVHPSFAIVKANPFAAKHTLDKYAILARYPHVTALIKGEPAEWIRYMQSALEKANGRYSHVTKKGKREWDALLEYNQHDCLALRHIVLKASRELDCWRAYQRTRFCVDDGSRRICFMDGSASPKLDGLLSRHGARKWAFLTAWNPGSVEVPRAKNDAEQARLLRMIEAAGYEWLPGRGIGENPAWVPEESLFVLGISRGKAVALGRRFGQLAVVVGRRGEPAQLIPSAQTPPSP